MTKIYTEIEGCGYSAFTEYYDKNINGVWQRSHTGYGVGAPSFAIKHDQEKRFSIYDLCFAHGSVEKLLNGSVCVVRNRMVGYKENCSRFSGLVDDPTTIRFNEKAIEVKDVMSYDIISQKDLPFKTMKVKEGKLLFIGMTDNGNSKIKLFL